MNTDRSSIPNKSSNRLLPQLDTIDDYNTTSPQLSQSEEGISGLKNKFYSQNLIIREYEQWLTTLLSLVKYTKYYEYLDKILFGLDKIEALQTEKEILRLRLSEEYKNNLDLRKKIDEAKTQIEKLKEKLMKKVGTELILDKYRLIDSINSLSQELDHYAFKNSKFREITENKKLNSLEQELKFLKEDNKLLKTRIKEKNNIASKFVLKESNEQWKSASGSFVSCCSVNSTKSEDSITMEMNYFKKLR